MWWTRCSLPGSGRTDAESVPVVQGYFTRRKRRWLMILRLIWTSFMPVKERNITKTKRRKQNDL